MTQENFLQYKTPPLGWATWTLPGLPQLLRKEYIEAAIYGGTFAAGLAVGYLAPADENNLVATTAASVSVLSWIVSLIDTIHTAGVMKRQYRVLNAALEVVS